MKIFSIDSPLFKFFSRLWDIIKLNFLWLICSIPIVTFGASTAAAFTITLNMVEDTEGYIVKPFFKAFKANLKKGIPLGLIFLVGVYGLYMDIQFIINSDDLTSNSSDYSWVFVALAIILGVMLYNAFVYSFALMARYENTLLGTIVNSYRIALKYVGRTVFLAVLIAVEVGLFIWNEILMAVGSLIAPVCIMLTISGFAMKFFRELEKEPGAVTNPEQLDIYSDEKHLEELYKDTVDENGNKRFKSVAEFKASVDAESETMTSEKTDDLDNVVETIASEETDDGISSGEE